MEIIKQIICCVLGTLGFAVIMKVPKNSLIFVALGGTISAGVERLTNACIGDFFSCLIAMICIVFYSEIMARVLKEPSTVILMPSTIPLLPGSAIYYSMLYAVHSNLDGFLTYAKLTLFAGLGIALGAIISTIVIKLIYVYKNI